MHYDPIYLTLEQILVIHQDQIDRYGGSHGLRDLTLLESAILRPQTTFSGEDLYPTLFNKAAALLHSLIHNHPFLDGNKRTASVSTAVFLIKNNYDLKVDNKKFEATILAIAIKKMSLEEIGVWLENNCIPLSN